MATSLSGVAAVILAGGKGERLGGVNKAMLEIGGERLIDKARRVVGGCDPVLVAVGGNDLAVDGLRAIADLPGDYAGPLAGVAAAVAALSNDPAQWLLSLAVDTPFFPLDFLTRARKPATDADVVLGCFGAQDYPTNALWRLAAIRPLPGSVLAGTAPHSLKRLAGSLRTARLDYATVLADDPFANANTPEDLDNLRLRAAPR